MRRAIPSFTVEVRRRPRLTTNSNLCVQPSETKIPQAGVQRESHPVAAAAFEAEKSNQFPVDVAASRPKGRILPSLVPEEPLRRQLRDTSLPSSMRIQLRVRKSGRVGAKRAGTDIEVAAEFGAWSDQAAPLVDNISAASLRSSGVPLDEGTGASPVAPSRIGETPARSHAALKGGKLGGRSADFCW